MYFILSSYEAKAAFRNSIHVTGPEGALAIADAVVLHHSIHSLFLSSNNIGPNGAISIARIVIASTSLTALNLKSNRLGPEGTQRWFVLQHQPS